MFDLLFYLTSLVSWASASESLSWTHVDSKSCTGGYTMQSGQFCYAYIDDKQTWAEAEATCTSLGGYLVEAYTRQDNDYLEKIMFEHSPEDMWMGGHDVITEGKWFWSSSGRAISDGFTFWGPGEPNDANNQDCMYFRFSSHHWDDLSCDVKLKFACQKPIGNAVIG